MRAVTIDNNQITVQERSNPTLLANQILVKVKAAGLNGADLLQMRGLYPPPKGYNPLIPGLEFSGEVVEIGSHVVDSFEIGDRVMSIVSGEAQAEMVRVEASHAIKIPSFFTFEMAGGFSEAYFTAYDALFNRGKVTLGTNALVTGASGGVGLSAINLLHKAGAQITATTRHKNHLEYLHSIGADFALTPDDDIKVKDLGPYDIVLELVGGNNFEQHITKLNTGGVYIAIGVSAGAKFTLNVLELMNRRAFITGSTLRSRSIIEKANLANTIKTNVLPILDANSVKIDKVFPLRDARNAYEYFENGGKLGKVILKID